MRFKLRPANPNAELEREYEGWQRFVKGLGRVKRKRKRRRRRK